MKWIFGIGIFLFMAACTLNATQEQSLSNGIRLYLKAVNEGSILIVASKTHPAFVKYARNKGVDFFKETFKSDEANQYAIANFTIKETEKKQAVIHVLFEAQNEDFYSKSAKKKFVAISENNGISWFFIPYKDYQNKHICKELIRIL